MLIISFQYFSFLYLHDFHKIFLNLQFGNLTNDFFHRDHLCYDTRTRANKSLNNLDDVYVREKSYLKARTNKHMFILGF